MASENFERFLNRMVEGASMTKRELAAWLDCSEGLVRSYAARARRMGVPVVWRKRMTDSGRARWVYFVADDYEAARPHLLHLNKVAIGVMRSAQHLVRALLKKGQGPEVTETLEALDKNLTDAIYSLAGVD